MIKFFLNLCGRIPPGGRAVASGLAGLISVVLWLFAIHRSLSEPLPLLDPERLFPLMRYVLKRGLLLAIVLGGIAYREHKAQKRFEWTFVALLSLNIVPIAFPSFSENFKTFIPLFRVILPWLVALYALVWMLPAKTDAFLRHLSTRKYIPFVIFLGLFVFYVGVGLAIFNAKGMRAGDEAHYMLMTKSLAEDGDLDLANNCDGFTWSKDFFSQHHLKMNSRMGKAYSDHPFGLPLILAPVYYFAGNLGIVVFLAFLSAFMGPLLFYVLRRETDDDLLRIAVTLLFSVLLPFCIYAIRPYPELLTSLCALLGYYVIVCRKSNHPMVYALAGCVMGYMSWLLVRRFIIPLLIIDIAAALRFMRERNLRGALLFFLPQVFFIGSLVMIDQHRFSCDGVLASEFIKKDGINVGGRTYSASGVMQRMLKMDVKRLEPCLAIFFDKRSGILWTNAFIVLMTPALLATLIIRFRTYWDSLLIVWLHIFLVGATGLCGWDAGVCHQPRYIVPILPFIAIPCVRLMERGFGSQKLKLGGGIWISIVLSFVSLIALLRIPFRFDTTFTAFSKLSDALADIHHCMPWFSSQFYQGAINHFHIWVFAAGLIVVSLLFWSKFRQYISRPLAFLTLAFMAMLMEYFF